MKLFLHVSFRPKREALASLIKLNYRDFFCTAYQHQESIRGVLTQEPRERNDAFDQLLDFPAIATS